ncbi:serine/threonine protein kinase [Lambiella insularis]|nr:serine/threonine protein kinase [Lambiella insularis]
MQLKRTAAGGNLRINGRYCLIRRLGGGSFGSIYQATDSETGDEVAVKLEYQEIEPSLLRDEVDIYKSLSGGEGIPQVKWSGWECECRAMVFDLLGPSLEDLFNYCNRRFSLKTVLMLADQLIARLQFIHSKKVLHQDIKPANFLMGTGSKGNCVYVTDLGLASGHFSSEAPQVTSQHQARLWGTAYFASVAGHRGIGKCKEEDDQDPLADRAPEQSQRDDMESLGYMLLYFLRGRLPWHNVKAASKQEKAERMMEYKASIRVDELCEDMPNEFKTYMNDVRALNFGEKPEYSKLRRMFRNLFVRHGFEHDYVFDWTIRIYLETTYIDTPRPQSYFDPSKITPGSQIGEFHESCFDQSGSEAVREGLGFIEFQGLTAESDSEDFLDVEQPQWGLWNGMGGEDEPGQTKNDSQSTQHTVFQAEALDFLPDSQETEEGGEKNLNPSYLGILTVDDNCQPKFSNGFTLPTKSWITIRSKCGRKT